MCGLVLNGASQMVGNEAQPQMISPDTLLLSGPGYREALTKRVENQTRQLAAGVISHIRYGANS